MASLDDFEVVAQIGSGSFGIICKVKRKSDSKVFAWKEVWYGKMSEKEKHQLVSEVNILRELRHPNIVRYYDRIIHKETAKIYIIMEYCEGGDLASLIKRLKKERKYLDEENVWKMLAQIMMGLNECHNFKTGVIVHRDIKPENVFHDGQNNYKLGDFGLSRLLNSEALFAQTFLGTPYYMSPEQLSQNGYNQKSDIWSLGCLIYEICALCPPFDAPNQMALNNKIRSGVFSRIPAFYSEELHKAIKLMLDVNPNNRPDTQAMLSMFPLRFYVKERKVNHMYVNIKKKEEELNQRLMAIEQKQRELERREAMMSHRERSTPDFKSFDLSRISSLSLNENDHPNSQHSTPNSSRQSSFSNY